MAVYNIASSKYKKKLCLNMPHVNVNIPRIDIEVLVNVMLN